MLLLAMVGSIGDVEGKRIDGCKSVESNPASCSNTVAHRLALSYFLAFCLCVAYPDKAGPAQRKQHSDKRPRNEAIVHRCGDPRSTIASAQKRTRAKGAFGGDMPTRRMRALPRPSSQHLQHCTCERLLRPLSRERMTPRQMRRCIGERVSCEGSVSPP